MFVALVVACNRSTPGDGASGAEVFATYCAMCHGPNGKPSAAMTAQLAVRDLTAPELRAKVSVQLVEDQVRKGSQNKLMPGFEGAISDAQIKAVAAWVASSAFVTQP
jgi:mono/diheme cytochrome c family protein